MQILHWSIATNWNFYTGIFLLPAYCAGLSFLYRPTPPSAVNFTSSRGATRNVSWPILHTKKRKGFSAPHGTSGRWSSFQAASNGSRRASMTCSEVAPWPARPRSRNTQHSRAASRYSCTWIWLLSEYVVLEYSCSPNILYHNCFLLIDNCVLEGPDLIEYFILEHSHLLSRLD